MGVVLLSAQKYVLPCTFSLSEPCTNNVAEYNALFISMKIAHELGGQYLKAYDDSALTVNHPRGKFEVRHKDLIPYHAMAIQVVGLFKTFYVQHIPRNRNSYAALWHP